MTTPDPTTAPTPQPVEPTPAPTPPPTPVADPAHESFAAYLADWLTHGPVERVFHLGELAKQAEAWIAHVRA